jgi:RecB family endonuclease NucS
MVMEKKWVCGSVARLGHDEDGRLNLVRLKRKYGEGERFPNLQEINPKEEKHGNDRHV